MKLNNFRGEVWINAHDEIVEAMVEANKTPIDGGYGNDSYTKAANALMQSFFDTPIYTTYTVTGTAANVMAMKSMLDRWSAIVCSEQTHINTYEAGAFEYTLGNKIISEKTADGKLTPQIIADMLLAHKKYKYKPKVITMAQPTEYGTVYTVDEIRAICDYAHANGMYVYVDGARIGNAVVALGTNLKEMLEDTGVDAFSFGGTKAGAMFGEMIVFFREEFNNYLDYMQKQSMQHMSKSKFLGVQLQVILEKELWLRDAEKSNAAAAYLEDKIREKGYEIYYKRETNMVFCVIEPDRFAKLCEKYDMHYWDEFTHVVRIATTHLTTKEEIDELAELL
ncbi:MAG: aminotransferase class V-fold PLP-dependent enzyme [Clostridia bacterium]|nr:aminotransferase class V-fold PLP-dependent enzyme [Clostridia bacterium]